MANQPEAPAEEQPAVKEPKKKKSWKILPSTLAGRASCLMALFLVILVATVWTLFFIDANNVPWRHSMGWLRITAIILLIPVIVTFLYYTIRYWAEAETSLFPDIDYAWKAGLEALSEHGVSLKKTPVFIVLGTHGEERAATLLQSAKLELRVEGAPKGAAPLYWFASPEAVYLVCSDTSWLSAQASRLFGRADRYRAPLASAAPMGAAPAQPRPAPPATSPQQIGPPPASPAPEPPPVPATPTTPQGGQRQGSGAYGTLVLEQFVPRQESPRRPPARAPETSAPAAAPADATSFSAVDPVGMVRDWEPATFDSPLDEEVGQVSPHMTTEESTQQLQRLEYVCQLLRNARHPVCPVNGLLAVFPYELFNCGDREVGDLTAAIKGDLKVLQRGLRLRMPVTALIAGMERERGFQEVVRRVGRDRALHQRFGQRFNIKSVATLDVLQAFMAHVTGTFEDWVYALFREEDSLTRPGNTHLYGLLSKVRCTFKARLANILIGAFALDTPAAREAGHFFSGCYFAATGSAADRQAFVQGVMQKLLDEQDEVEWTEAAFWQNRRTNLVLITGLLASAAMLALLAYRIGESFLRQTT